MINDPIFHGPAQVEIQGPRVLHLEHEPAPAADHAEFQLIGFDDPVVKILDYRTASLEVLKEVLSTWQHHLFAPRFNQPADVTLWSPRPGEIQIDLRETTQKRPAHMLWIAIGMDQDLPVYDYLYRDIAPMEGDRYTLLSIYERPRHREPARPISTHIA